MNEDVMPYRKKSKKKPPKKASHAHQWESIILSYWNKHLNFSREKGFIGGTDECAGKRCSVCGRLEIGFPKGSPEEIALFTGRYLFSNTIYNSDKFKDLERVPVDDILNLNK